ncbi:MULTISPECIES: hypothetical protein [unclassified Bradyrhizobium]|nr:MULTISPECIES: hypothetical protein [unclassified Bradyrhizobium]MDH2347112.1 hypothetical protein [Bradyrhizobium sp. SSUT77]MDH2357591.1 hypothetical protein [Bradyrhizobium sp. SSUT112]
MKYAAERTFVDPDAAARKLVEIANAVDQRPPFCIRLSYPRSGSPV